MTYPFTRLVDKTSQVHGRGRDMTRRVLDEPMVETANLEQVLAKCSRLNIVVIRLGYPTKEVHGVGVRKVVVESLQNEFLCLQDFFLSEAVIGDVTEVLDVWGENLFVLGCDEHSGDADEL